MEIAGRTDARRNEESLCQRWLKVSALVSQQLQIECVSRPTS